MPKGAWTDSQIEKLKTMAAAGASAARIAAAVGRKITAIKVMGSKLGIRFQPVRQAKKEREEKFEAAQKASGRLPDQFH